MSEAVISFDRIIESATTKARASSHDQRSALCSRRTEKYLLAGLSSVVIGLIVGVGVGVAVGVALVGAIIAFDCYQAKAAKVQGPPSPKCENKNQAEFKALASAMNQKAADELNAAIEKAAEVASPTAPPQPLTQEQDALVKTAISRGLIDIWDTFNMSPDEQLQLVEKVLSNAQKQLPQE